MNGVYLRVAFNWTLYGNIRWHNGKKLYSYFLKNDLAYITGIIAPRISQKEVVR